VPKVRILHFVWFQLLHERSPSLRSPLFRVADDDDDDDDDDDTDDDDIDDEGIADANLLTLADVKPAVEAWAVRAAVGTTRIGAYSPPLEDKGDHEGRGVLRGLEMIRW
jgi:hypothetical protein